MCNIFVLLATCMSQFMTSVEEDVTWLLLTNQMSGVCEKVQRLVTCLKSIPDTGGVRRMALHDALQSMSYLNHQCEHWYEEHPTGRKLPIKHIVLEFIELEFKSFFM